MCRGRGWSVVDAMPAALGRDPIRLGGEQSAERGRRHCDHRSAHSKWYQGLSWTIRGPPEVLAGLFIADIIDGIDRYDYMGPVIRRTSHRAGILKVAVLEDAPTRP